MTRQEDNIKSYLHMLGMQEQFNQTAYTPRQPPQRAYFGNDISDWNNQRDFTLDNLESSASLPRMGKKLKIIQGRSNSMELTSFHLSALKYWDGRKKQESMLLINPIEIKFNSQVCKSKLPRSYFFQKLLQEDSKKKGQDPRKLRQILRRIKPSFSEEKGGDNQRVSPPRTQRCSGILRMLKRREQIRIMKKKQKNPQALTAVKLPSK